MTFQTKQLGAMGENLAANLLLQKKYRILNRNLRTKFGEIDILAADPAGPLVIVEVKAKTNLKYGAAIEMITPAKQRKLILLAHELQASRKTSSVRIDIVTVDDVENIPIIKHHKGVVEFHAR